MGSLGGLNKAPLRWNRQMAEIRTGLGLRRRPARSGTSGRGMVVRALLQLARNRTGALLMLPGREPLARHLQGGVELDAAISEELLMSIFDPHSAGYDGAVLLQLDIVGVEPTKVRLSGRETRAASR